MFFATGIADLEMTKSMAPIGVTFVTKSMKSGLVATGGYKAWKAAWKSGDWAVSEGQKNEPHRQSPEEPVAGSKYEVAALAVHLSFQKHGLATKLLTMIEEEIASKTRQIGKTSFILLVRTGKENNERFWTKKGFVTRSQLYFKPGEYGSKRGFTMLEMAKQYQVLKARL